MSAAHSLTPPPGFDFVLPPDRNAAAPPEHRGLARQQVRLLVSDRRTGTLAHSRFDQIGEYLHPGDLLVLNNSRTIPAVLHGALAATGAPVEVRLARRLGASRWLGFLPGRPALPHGTVLRFALGLTAQAAGADGATPLQHLNFSRSGMALWDTLYQIGTPVRYEYAAQEWSLADYQTVYASAPGSIEMPSAGRAFTWSLLAGLRRAGIALAFLSLHAGLSYYDDRWSVQPDQTPEEYVIPPETARAVTAARRGGGRVIAVGTTVVRALESAAGADGAISPCRAWSNAYIQSGSKLRAVDGLLTGLHEPRASHLELLTAFAAPNLLRAAYAEAIAQGYLWHEFGDAHLIL